MSTPCILTWSLPVISPAGAALAACAGQLGVRVTAVSAQQAGEPVGKLAGLPVAPASKPVSDLSLPAGAAVVFCGLEEGQLDQLLAALRASGQAIPLKAVLTPHNQSWPFASLLQELQAERDSFAGRRPAP